MERGDRQDVTSDRPLVAALVADAEDFLEQVASIRGVASSSGPRAERTTTKTFSKPPKVRRKRR